MLIAQRFTVLRIKTKKLGTVEKNLLIQHWSESSPVTNSPASPSLITELLI